MEDEGLNIKGFTGIEGYSSNCLLRFFGGVPPLPPRWAGGREGSYRKDGEKEWGWRPWDRGFGIPASTVETRMYWFVLTMGVFMDGGVMVGVGLRLVGGLSII